jgi:four helix bundle protein
LQQRAFEFACRIVNLHDILVTRGVSARDLGRQLMHAGTSIGANLEEADAAQSKPTSSQSARSRSRKRVRRITGYGY